MAPDIISFVQDTFHEGFFEKANLPTVVRIHDNSCCLPFSDVLEDLFNSLGVGQLTWSRFDGQLLWYRQHSLQPQ